MNDEKVHISMFVRECPQFRGETAFSQAVDLEIKASYERVLNGLQTKIVMLEEFVKAVQEKDAQLLPDATAERLKSVRQSCEALDSLWNHLFTRQAARATDVYKRYTEIDKAYAALVQSTQHHMHRHGCVVPAPFDGPEVKDRGPPPHRNVVGNNLVSGYRIGSGNFQYLLMTLENYFTPRDKPMIQNLILEQMKAWKPQSITQIKSHRDSNENKKSVLSGKLYNLFQDIPQCLIDLAAAKGLLKYKENLANMREDLTFEREALAERHALEQRRLRRKMEDEKRRLEDLEDLPIPPEEDLVPPRRSVQEDKAKRCSR